MARWKKKKTKPTRKKENISLALPNESQNWGDNHFVPLLQRKKLTFAANRFHNRRYCKVTPLYKIMTSYANDQEADLNYRKTFPRDGFNEEPATKWNARSLTRKIDKKLRAFNTDHKQISNMDGFFEFWSTDAWDNSDAHQMIQKNSSPTECL